ASAPGGLVTLAQRMATFPRLGGLDPVILLEPLGELGLRRSVNGSKPRPLLCDRLLLLGLLEFLSLIIRKVEVYDERIDDFVRDPDELAPEVVGIEHAARSVRGLEVRGVKYEHQVAVLGSRDLDRSAGRWLGLLGRSLLGGDGEACRGDGRPLASHDSLG